MVALRSHVIHMYICCGIMAQGKVWGTAKKYYIETQHCPNTKLSTAGQGDRQFGCQFEADCQGRRIRGGSEAWGQRQRSLTGSVPIQGSWWATGYQVAVLVTSPRRGGCIRVIDKSCVWWFFFYDLMHSQVSLIMLMNKPWVCVSWCADGVVKESFFLVTYSQNGVTQVKTVAL